MGFLFVVLRDNVSLTSRYCIDFKGIWNVVARTEGGSPLRGHDMTTAAIASDIALTHATKEGP
jgi:hypothetical protein